jgi:hypothetical protein
MFDNEIEKSNKKYEERHDQNGTEKSDDGA